MSKTQTPRFYNILLLQYLYLTYITPSHCLYRCINQPNQTLPLFHHIKLFHRIKPFHC